jgi:DNA sulfur modification protein DndD
VKFERLTVKNFGPYRGEQSINFPQDRDHSVLVVFGDNMRGKTSLLNSLRWVLYGSAIDRQAKRMPLIQLLNTDAQQDGDWHLQVSLTFVAEGHHYDLRRSTRPHDLITSPTDDRDFSIDVFLTKDGSAVRADLVEHEISRYIPQQISRFYLFDSELLQEYETLLITEAEQGRHIKEAIERILGVPALINGRDDLRSLLKASESVLAHQAKSIAKLAGFADQHIRLRGELDAHNADLAKLEGDLSEISRDQEKIADELQSIAAIDSTLRQLRLLEDRQKASTVRAEALRDEYLLATKDLWRDLLCPRIAMRRAEIARRIADQRVEIGKRAVLVAEVENLSRLLSFADCPFCGSQLRPERRAAVTESLDEHTARLLSMDESVVALGELSAELAVLSRFTPVGSATALIRADTELRKLSIEQTRDESAAEQLNELLRSHDKDRVAKLQRGRDNLLERRGQVRALIQQSQSLIDEKSARAEHLSSLLSKSNESRTERTSLEVRTYSMLSSVFAASIARLRDEVKRRVEAEASATFLELTTEKTYKGLRINDNYGLTIIDRSDNPVSVRSAGAEQVVAMSLLIALNKTADRPGPVVIDTPFARLDPLHRLNILRLVPRMAEQVVFLVHEGELSREDGLGPIADHVGGVYEIQRISSSQSELRSERGGRAL